MTRILPFIALLTVLSSCVSKKKYADLQAENERLKVSAPIRQAAADKEVVLMEDLKNELSMVRNQMTELDNQIQHYRTMEEAGKMEQPTQEQMEAYRLQNEERMQKAEEARTQAEVEGNLDNSFAEGFYGIQVVGAALEEAIKGYNSQQAVVQTSDGKSVLSISANELFDEGKSSINANGKVLLNKVSVALNLKQPLYYRIVAVTEKEGNMQMAADRAVNTRSYLAGLKEPGHVPTHLGMTTCTKAVGPSSVSCERVEFIFHHNYDMLVNEVTRILMD